MRAGAGAAAIKTARGATRGSFCQQKKWNPGPSTLFCLLIFITTYAATSAGFAVLPGEDNEYEQL
jgi:hypothetical protein